MTGGTQIYWLGSTRDDLRGLPEEARQRIGYQLHRVQNGDEPDDWKPMTSIGVGCREIRVRTADGQYRSIYIVAGQPTGIYVLAVFTKKSQATPEPVKALAKKRLTTVKAHIKGQQQ